IAPFNAQRTIIQGNFIGVGYDGTTALGNGAEGITFGGGSIDVQVINNVIANNGNNGVGFYQSSNNGLVENNTIFNNTQNGVAFDASNDGTVSGNTITDNTQDGVYISNASLNALVDGNTIANNTQGISVFNSSGSQIGGTTSQGNQLSGNVQCGVAVYTFGGVSDSNTIQGNTIENSLLGIRITNSTTNTLIGGTASDRRNVIRNNTEAGVAVAQFTASALPATFTPLNNSILGNSIYNNTVGLYGSGLGIDLAEFIDASGPPDGIPESLNEIGVTNNDPGDTDSGANDHLNFPVINSSSTTAGSLSLNFDLDVDDSATGYRVEFFANSTADPSGHGEGQIYLGSTNVSGSVTGATANLTIPSSFTSGSYAISATTTEIDDSTNGFGNTSEFSAVLGDQTVLAAISSTTGSNNSAGGSLANTGQNLAIAMWVGGGLLLSGVAITLIPRLRRSKR
ncbi:right-handed parallel beta-helix repeat-containing protein, partial [bacterium]|nr:right-handed parallel beta-helix repeat-containing protein [bacterium]